MRCFPKPFENAIGNSRKVPVWFCTEDSAASPSKIILHFMNEPNWEAFSEKVMSQKQIKYHIYQLYYVTNANVTPVRTRNATPIKITPNLHFFNFKFSWE